MKLKPAFTLALLFFSAVCIGQNKTFDLNVECQVYPTGIIPGLRLEHAFAQKNAVHLRLGYQIIDHRDLGKHDDETGSGYGLTVGYKRYFKQGFKGFSLALRNDIWFNDIDWVNTSGILTTQGNTDVTVVQPTLEAGWLFVSGKKFIFSPTLAFGYEINVKTKGEPTGEGAILLMGLLFGYRFAS